MIYVRINSKWYENIHSIRLVDYQKSDAKNIKRHLGCKAKATERKYKSPSLTSKYYEIIGQTEPMEFMKQSKYESSSISHSDLQTVWGNMPCMTNLLFYPRHDAKIVNDLAI